MNDCKNKRLNGEKNSHPPAHVINRKMNNFPPSRPAVIALSRKDTWSLICVVLYSSNFIFNTIRYIIVIYYISNIMC